MNDKLTWKGFFRAFSARYVISRLALILLAFSASYGVYQFALLYSPNEIALCTAGAFELTYIGLALSPGLTATKYKRARAISLCAVLVSVLYNSISGLMHRAPDLVRLDMWSILVEVSLAVLHGAPLAIVAFLVADLLLHPDQAITPVPTAPAAPAPLVVAPNTPAHQAAPVPTRTATRPDQHQHPRPVMVDLTQPAPPLNRGDWPELITDLFGTAPDKAEALVDRAVQIGKAPPDATFIEPENTVQPPDVRRALIAEMVRSGQKINQAELARQFGVSPSLIRKDLAKIGEMGETAA